MNKLLIFLFLAATFGGNCQDSGEKQEIKKNLIYVSAGSVLFQYTINGFYERTFLRTEDFSFGGRLGAGRFEGFSNSGMNYNAELMLHVFFIEAGLGFTGRDFDDSDKDGTAFAFNLGIRLYTKNRIFMLRGGISLPEGLYLGVGFGFN